jgi:hypothetical protein
MSDEYTPTSQDIAADRDWWQGDAGKHYRELAHWLRGIAAKCRLPNPQRELLDLARHYDIRASSATAWLPRDRRRARGDPVGNSRPVVIRR